MIKYEEFEVVVKKHNDEKWSKHKPFKFTPEELKEIGDIDNFLAGTDGLIWDFYDQEECYVDEINKIEGA